jgi:hypothetical protein
LALLSHLPFCQDCGIDSIDELRFGEHPCSINAIKMLSLMTIAACPSALK